MTREAIAPVVTDAPQPESIEQAVARLIASAPKLTSAQLDTLSGILRDRGTSPHSAVTGAR